MEERAEDVAIVELSPVPALEEPSAKTKRPPRAFALPPPHALEIPADSDAAADDEKGQTQQPRLKAPAELVKDFEALSADCAERGPLLFYVRGGARAGSRGIGVAVVCVVALFFCVLSAFSYNLSCIDASRPLRVLGIVLTKLPMFLIQAVIVQTILFMHYPALTRSWRAIGCVVALMLPYIVFYVAEWSLFPTKELYFDRGEPSEAQRVLTFFADVLGFWIYFIGPFMLGRHHWRSVLGQMGIQRRKKSLKERVLNQGFAMHACLFLLLFLQALGVALCAFGFVSYTVARLFGVVAVVPIAILAAISVVRPAFSWNGGYAAMFSLLQFSTNALANILLTVMKLDISGSSSNDFVNVLASAVKFFAFYLFYGIAFSICQVVVSRMTEEFHAPQFLFIIQIFLDTFVGLVFVELRTTSEFATLLVLQTAWALFRSSGMNAWVYLKTKDLLLSRVKGVSQHHDASYLLKRDQYFWLLNAQSVFSDVIAAVAVPLIISIDFALPFGACSVSCSFTSASLTAFIKRYAIVLAVRIAVTTATVLSYAWRYARISKHGSMWLAAKSLLTAFSLHVWRNLWLFAGVIGFLFLYMVRPIITEKGFGGASSSSSSSLVF